VREARDVGIAATGEADIEDLFREANEAHCRNAAPFHHDGAIAAFFSAPYLFPSFI